MLPRARKKDLIIEKVDDETLVYDLTRDRAHCLNESASMVWRCCDGKSDLDKISHKLSKYAGAPVRKDVVELALHRLSRAHLLEEKVAKSSRLGRREVLRILAKTTAIGLPIVTSIVAPDAAAAQSCLPTDRCGEFRSNGRCCCNGKKCKEKIGQCNSGSCVT